MAVDHEPRLVVPPLSAVRSLFLSVPSNVRNPATGVKGSEGLGQAGDSSEGYICNEKGERSFKGDPRHNHMKVSAWEGTLPRLGFGSIDFKLLLDYEKRPKTPGDVFVEPPSSPTRLPTPPYTPEEKHIRLSAGLVVPALADTTSSNSPTYTASRSMVQDSTRVQSTLQSSPPSRLPELASPSKLQMKPQRQAPRPNAAIGLPGTTKCSALSTTNSPVSETSQHESWQAYELSQSGLMKREPPSNLIYEKDIHGILGSSNIHELPAISATTSPGLWAVKAVNYADCLGSNKGSSPITVKSRITTPTVVLNPSTPSSGVDANRYLEILRAAAQLTPHSREPASREVLAKESLGASSAKIISPVQVGNKNPRQLEVIQQSSRARGKQVRPSSVEATPIPPVLQTPSKLNKEEIYSLLNLSHVGPPESQNRTHHGSLTPINLNFVVLNSEPDDEDEDDGESGGCSVTPMIQLKQEKPAARPKSVHFMQRKPSQAEKSIQDTFRAQVQEVAIFSTKFQTEPLATKEQKFDNLLKKVISKNILHNKDDQSHGKDVHVFVDMSNIFIGFQESAKISQGLPLSARVTFSPFCFEHLAFVLERGRKIVKRKLAGSVRQAHQMNSLPSHIREAQSYGYDAKILHQVTKLDSNPSFQSSAHTSSDEALSGVLCPRTKLGEQGVDEALHLSMQDSILDAHGYPGVMVLATGDAKPAEYSDGFAHYALKALKHGWRVEVVSWRKCLSGEWKKSPFKDEYAKQFRIILLDDYFDEIHADWVGGPAKVLARV